MVGGFITWDDTPPDAVLMSSHHRFWNVKDLEIKFDIVHWVHCFVVSDLYSCDYEFLIGTLTSLGIQLVILLIYHSIHRYRQICAFHGTPTWVGKLNMQGDIQECSEGYIPTHRSRNTSPLQTLPETPTGCQVCCYRALKEVTWEHGTEVLNRKLCQTKNWWTFYLRTWKVDVWKIWLLRKWIQNSIWW